MLDCAGELHDAAALAGFSPSEAIIMLTVLQKLERLVDAIDLSTGAFMPVAGLDDLRAAYVNCAPTARPGRSHPAAGTIAGKPCISKASVAPGMVPNRSTGSVANITTMSIGERAGQTTALLANGYFMYEIFREVGIDFASKDPVITLLDQVTTFLSSRDAVGGGGPLGGGGGPGSRGSYALEGLRSFLVRVFRNEERAWEQAHSYRTLIYEPADTGAGSSRGMTSAAAGPEGIKRRRGRTVSFWCFSPGVAMQVGGGLVLHSTAHEHCRGTRQSPAFSSCPAAGLERPWCTLRHPRIGHAVAAWKLCS